MSDLITMRNGGITTYVHLADVPFMKRSGYVEVLPEVEKTEKLEDDVNVVPLVEKVEKKPKPSTKTAKE
jgi:hypothetical protein